jgi:hypothetical protein
MQIRLPSPKGTNCSRLTSLIRKTTFKTVFEFHFMLSTLWDKTSGFNTSGFKTSGFKTSERQVYKTSGLQNVRFTKRQVYKMSGLQNVRLQKNIRRFCCSHVCRQSEGCVFFSILEGCFSIYHHNR